MRIKLPRRIILLLSLIIIIIFYLINRLNKIIKSDFAYGKITEIEIVYLKNTKDILETIPHIEFEAAGHKFKIKGTPNTKYKLNDKIRVIYDSKNPQNAKIYSLLEFWILPFLYYLIPIMISSAIILSFIEPNGFLVIKTENNKSKSLVDCNLPEKTNKP